MVYRQQNLLPLLGFGPQSIQLIASCYTQYAIPAPTYGQPLIKHRELPSLSAHGWLWAEIPNYTVVWLTAIFNIHHKLWWTNSSAKLRFDCIYTFRSGKINFVNKHLSSLCDLSHCANQTHANIYPSNITYTLFNRYILMFKHLSLRKCEVLYHE